MTTIVSLVTKPVKALALKWTGVNEDEMQSFLYDGHQHSAAGWVKGSYVEVGTPIGLKVASVGHYVVRLGPHTFDVMSEECLKVIYDIEVPDV